MIYNNRKRTALAAAQASIDDWLAHQQFHKPANGKWLSVAIRAALQEGNQRPQSSHVAAPWVSPAR